MINADGTGLVTLAEVFAGKPSWSPDGNQIAYTSLDEPLRVFAADVATGRVSQLISGPGVEQSWPAWSPDGREIAFSVNGDDATASGLYVQHGDGSARRQATTGNDFDATWSPDGTRLAFNRTIAGVPQILVVNLASGTTEQLTSSRAGASISSW